MAERGVFFPAKRDRQEAISAGFRFGQIGTHTSRTMMLEELSATFVAVSEAAKASDYVAAIVEENCLGKQTVSTRRLTLQRLRELYALDPAVPIFRILRRLWNLDEQSRSLLALLVSLARDPLLLATSDTILSLPAGAEFQRTAMRDAIGAFVKDRFNESTLNKVVRNAASTWTQSGHLDGRTFKFRRTVQSSPAAISLALYLAHAAGLAAEESMISGWIKILDCSASSTQELAMAAKRIGLLDLRIAGNVIDLNLDRLDPAYLTASTAR